MYKKQKTEGNSYEAKHMLKYKNNNKNIYDVCL